MDDGRQRPRAGAGALSVRAEDRIGGSPQQLDLWPAPAKGRAVNSLQAALGAPGQPRLGSDRSPHPKFLLLDSIGAAAPEPGPVWDGIGVSERDELATAAPAVVTRTFRPAVIATALAAVLALGWAGGWSSYHALVGTTPAPLEQASTADCATGSGEEAGCAASKSDREVPPPATVPRKAAAAPANAASRGHEAPRGAAQRGAPTTKESSAAQQHASAPASPSVSRERAEESPRLVAVPETRPTTIEGWTIREVFGSTVVLEGPDGVWRAARGDTVPGLGRVELDRALGQPLDRRHQQGPDLDRQLMRIGGKGRPTRRHRAAGRFIPMLAMSELVMPALVAGIHVLHGSGPAMTWRERRLILKIGIGRRPPPQARTAHATIVYAPIV